jgi:2-succinyl-5-enolpyruvyl-6-hydroxy-3-cyclohexene-1-carboxylate synthase
MDRLAESISAIERGVLVAGWLDPWSDPETLDAVAELASTTGWPLLAEPLSGLRRPASALSAAQHLLVDQAFAEAHPPEVVLQVGGTPTTRATQALVARAGSLVVVGDGPADPERRADITLRANPGRVAAALVQRLGRSEPANGAWERAWRAADLAARTAVDATLDRCDEPFEGRLARDLAAALPDGAMLFVGSSMPVRDLDAYMAPRAGLRMVGNRGASGIDGSVSTTLGMASAARISSARTPTFALLGDLALLHDAGALLWGGRRGDPIVFVVPNNDGGGIFDHLAVSTVPEHERLFVTPHGLDLGALAVAAEVGYELVDRPDELVPAIRRAGGLGGVRIIEVPIDRRAGLRIRADVRDAVGSALSQLA